MLSRGERRIRRLNLIWINALVRQNLFSSASGRHEVCARMLDLVCLVRLFTEVGGTKLKVAQFRPLAAVLGKPVVRKLRAAGHEFYWSPQAQLESGRTALQALLHRRS